MYGFGAKIPPTHTFTTHCFALTGNFLDPEVEGVAGIVDIYRQVLAASVGKSCRRACPSDAAESCAANVLPKPRGRRALLGGDRVGSEISAR